MVSFIRRYLKLDPHDNLFLYVPQSFAPSLDTEIGTLPLLGMPFNCQKQISTGCDLLQKFLYASVNEVLFRLNAYPSASFQSACLFGVPIKVCSNESVRDYILGFTNCLNLYNTGHQELVMRFEATQDSYLVTGNHLVFRFECYALREGQAFSSATWVKHLRQALIRLSLYEAQSFPRLKDSHWDLLTRNWFPSQGLSQPDLPAQFTMDNGRDSLSQSTPAICTPVFSVFEDGLFLVVFQNTFHMG
ncbi:hypothetical protein AAHC03_09323 [Spirometra sp. Aus1]